MAAGFTIAGGAIGSYVAVRYGRGVSSLSLLAILGGLGGCTALSHGFPNPQGPVAGQKRDLFVTVSIMLLSVVGPVLLLTPLFTWHYRLSNRNDAYRRKGNSRGGRTS